MRRKVLSTLLVLALQLTSFPCVAQTPLDPNDPFDFGFSNLFGNTEESDETKTAEQLLQEAQFLFMDERPLDARSKLLIALKKDPKNYEVHRFLAGYYMIHVGHYRLALKYIKKAMQLFEEQRGKAPYQDVPDRAAHAQLLYFLSQIRLNLDNYQGSLDTLDEYASFGYYEDWYPGTRAWTLMKLGKIEEAVRVARLGVLENAEPGRTMNILGILLSVSNEREASLAVFRKALEYELSLGDEGQPATPLNNSGEVLREIFREEEAERSWQRALNFKDSCEHILPYLNLTILAIEKGEYQEGDGYIDQFEACVAQFPLRNGEEHRAFLHLARGRLAMHAGYTAKAIEHFEQALDKRQWFGKIGTSENDLRAAASMSYALALEFHANRLSKQIPASFYEGLLARLEIAKLRLKSWWVLRRTRELMVEDMSDMEDLYVRHSDSMIEYPTMGSFLASFPFEALHKRISKEKEQDDRALADLYYNAYEGEALFEDGETEEAKKRVSPLLQEARAKYDKALRIHLLGRLLAHLATDSKEYAKYARELFLLSPAALRNYGHTLPVRFDTSLDTDIRELLLESGFTETQNSKDAEYVIRELSSSPQIRLEWSSRNGTHPTMSATSEDPREAVNALSEKVFQIPLRSAEPRQE